MAHFNADVPDKILKDRTRNPQLVNIAVEERLKNESKDVKTNIKRFLINTKDKATVRNQLITAYGEVKGNFYYNKLFDFISIRKDKKYKEKTPKASHQHII